MDYQKHYNALIAKAKYKEHEGYTEIHHILPKCLGGSDLDDNLVRLTPEEHYVAHQLLVKMNPENHKLIYALNMMSMGRKSNKRYGWIKRKHQQICKLRKGKHNPSFGKHWFYDPNTGKNGKFAEGTQPEFWVKGRAAKKTRTRSCIICGEFLDEIPAIISNKRRYCNVHKPKCKPKFLWHTPNGIFETGPEAAEANNCSLKTLYNRAKSNKFVEYYMGD